MAAQRVYVGYASGHFETYFARTVPFLKHHFHVINDALPNYRVFTYSRNCVVEST